ncbi:MAG: SGNH/GDSL hydrolase family protein [Chitinophagaceae bacterium]
MKTIRKKIKSFSTAFAILLLLPIFIVPMHHAPVSPAYSLLALGDSYTIGESVPPADNFPNQVHRLLQEKGLSFRQPEIIAQTGWTTDELQDAIRQAGITGTYDFVTLLIGVNNQYRGRDTAGYAPQFESLLQQAIAFAGHQPGHVIVLSIPDWGITPFAAGRDREQIGREIGAFNVVNKRLAADYQAHYIDITPGTRRAAADPSLLAGDGLHPSGKEYAGWATQVAAIIEKQL